MRALFALLAWLCVAGAAVAQMPPGSYGPGPIITIIPGNQTPVAATAMKIDWLLQNSTFPLQNEASIWAQNTYAYLGVSKEFTNTSVPSAGGSPLASFFAFANNNGSPGDIVALLGDAVARQSNGTVFGGNIIARSSGSGALTGLKLVGAEIDVEPAVGDTVSTGGGLFINAFNSAMPVPGLQIGGVGGGTFQNGIVVNGIVSGGAALAPQAGASMGTMMNSVGATLSDAAIRLGNQQPIKLVGSDAADCTVTTDNNRFLIIKTCTTGLAIQSAAGGNQWLILTSGRLQAGSAGALLQGSVTDAITAHSGGGQASATALVSMLNHVTTVAAPADSVSLIASAAGLCQIVTNDSSNAMQLFGAGTDTINNVATATGVSVPAGKTGQWCSPVVGKWYGGTWN